MTKAKNQSAGGGMTIRCPACDIEGIELERCNSSKPTWFYRCPFCQARGFLPERALEAARENKKIFSF